MSELPWQQAEQEVDKIVAMRVNVVLSSGFVKVGEC